MDNIVLGRYLPLNSYIHKLDPRAKIMSMIVLLVAIFIPAGFFGYALLGSFVLIVIVLSKLHFSYILKAMKPMLFMLIFLFVINILVIRSGTLLIDVGFIKIYNDAISQTLFIVVRLALMISITTILTTTTKPLDLTLGIEDLLSPFKRVGVPAHIIAMMISIALRFIPTLIEETQRIMKAQASRGVDFEQGKLMEKIRGILSLIVPLFISAFQRAEDLAYAMEARGYIPDAHRTRYRQLQIQSIDIIAMVLSCFMLVYLIWYAFL